MRSSRSFHPLGVTRLLKMGVYISTSKELVSFYQFMKRNFIDKRKTARQLTELTIAVDWDEDRRDAMAADMSSDCESMQDLPSRASLLIPVLGCVTNLQRLAIDFCEIFLECDDQLGHAIASLTTLRELHIKCHGICTYELVANLRSSLRKVHVDFGDEVPNQPGEDHVPDLLDPLRMLLPHQGTLLEVTIHAADLAERLLTPNGYIFPQVHTLVLKRCQVTAREVIMNAFPNVNRLELFCVEVGNGQEDPPVDVDEVRAVNLAYPKQWAPLDFVYANVDSLFTLGFRSRVGRLDVALWEFKEVDIEHLRMVLADVQPRRLVVQWGYWDAYLELSTEFSPERLGKLFVGVDERVINEITHFGLDLGLKNLTEDPALYKVCASLSCRTHCTNHYSHNDKDAVAQLLATLLHVRCFAFRLHAVAREYEDDFANATPEDREDDTVDTVEVLAAGFGDEVLAALATQIAATAQSVTLLCFFVMSRRVFWRVARDAGGSLTRIGEEEGERLMAAEGMRWHCPSKIWWPGNPEYDE